MKKSLKIAIYVLLASGFAIILMVLASSLIDPTSNQAKNQSNNKGPYAVLGKLHTLSPRPARPTAGFIDATKTERFLSEFEGKVILLNIWATWCEPCVAEMPSLDALQAKLGGDDFEVVAISVDTSLAVAKEFYTQYNIEHLSLYQDPNFKVVQQLYVKNYPTGLPITVLYNRRGQELARLSGGFDWVSDVAITRIEQAISASTIKE